MNQELLARFLKRNITSLADSVALTMLPVVADLIDVVPVRRWVYYCVDNFAVWPGLDCETLQVMEEVLVARVDRVVAAGHVLASRLRAQGRDPVVITHGVDLEHWSLSGRNQDVPTSLTGLDRPIAMFWGLIDRRLDLSLLDALGRSMRQGSIVLVGPEQDPDCGLATIPRLCRVGPMSFEDLPAAAASADVLIMPYADLPVTRAMQPLKLKEYLATGKPVVVRNLPAVQEWDDTLDAVQSPREFVQAVRKRFREGLPNSQKAARTRLGSEAWSAKANMLKEVLFGV